MKKLMIAAVAVCAAAMTQAATVDWAATADAFYVGNGGYTALDGGQKAWLINGTYGQDTLLQAFVQAGSTAALEATLTANQIDVSAVGGDGTVVGSGTTTLDSGKGAPGYIAIVNGANLYISTIVSAAYDEKNEKYTFNFNESYDPYDASVPEVMNAKGGLQGEYDGAGWYTTSAVPEPTSGLLLLLGVAGLALKRKRA